MEGTAVSAGYQPKLLSAVSAVNDQQKSLLYKKIHSYFDGQLEGLTVALWGLAFKPGTDDMREAPSRDLMEALWQQGARVQAFDPHGMEATQEIYGVRDDLLLCGTKVVLKVISISPFSRFQSRSRPSNPPEATIRGCVPWGWNLAV